ncbi:MAG: bestrophin family protein [Bacteroidia bacterium]
MQITKKIIQLLNFAAMISYNPKDWFKLITQFRKNDTFVQLIPSMLGIGILSAIVVLLELYVWHWSYKNITVVHSILGFVLSMLLVFRTNSAYDRWWEGRKLWGNLVNQSRNLSIKINSYLKEKNDKQQIVDLINHYNYSLKNHLRGKRYDSENPELSAELKSELATISHIPNYFANILNRKLVSLKEKNALTEMQLLLLNTEFVAFTDICGACERIKNTPIPYSYNIYLKKIIFLYVITLPFAFGPEFGFLTVFISMIVLYVFASIELIAEEIEDPFGADDNDLPLDDLCEKIKANTQEIISK